MPELPGVHLALVGPDEGHETGRLARAAAARDERIHVLPPVDDPLPLYADADVVVLPSEGDSFGMAAAEAVSCGVPVVVSDQAGVAEFVDGAALVVPLSRPTLREAIARVLDDEALASTLAEAGPRVAAANDADAIVERQLAIYRTLLSAG
jgi:glycosyltransferase involved in cell wall biosynthesis